MILVVCQMDTEAKSREKTAGFVIKSPPFHDLSCVAKKFSGFLSEESLQKITAADLIGTCTSL